MKANEAPEKIIISADRDSKELNDYWVLHDYTDDIKIEYIRTDVFIEKTCKWLEKNIAEATGIDSYAITESFKKYMEEQQ